MGTNYYRIKHIDKDTKKKINELVDNNDLDELSYFINEIKDKYNTHICKTSIGWKTSFDHNKGKYYNLSRTSLEKFLKEPDTHIENEYGEIIPFDEFWKIIDERDANPKNYLTSETYKKEYNDYKPDYCDEFRQECERLFGVMTPYTDFYKGGLRWMVFTDFS